MFAPFFCHWYCEPSPDTITLSDTFNTEEPRVHGLGVKLLNWMRRFWQRNSGLGLASSLEFFLGVPRPLKHTQHHNHPPDDEIENTVRKLAQVHPTDIREANGMEERFIAQPPEQVLCFRLQTQSDASLLPFIPGGRLGEVNPDERMEVEPELHGGSRRKSGPIPVRS
jgi:hypothetical protein